MIFSTIYHIINMGLMSTEEKINSLIYTPSSGGFHPSHIGFRQLLKEIHFFRRWAAAVYAAARIFCLFIFSM